MVRERNHDPDERLADLFQPDTVLPEQFFVGLRRRSVHEGELRLMVAILEDAVECYRKHVLARDHRGKQLFKEAEEWIESTERNWLYSFENICAVLGLDPDYLRRGLRAWKERCLARAAAREASKVVPLREHQASAGQRPRAKLKKVSGA